jgi:uncharacterized SAM-binding protein YcdF (DUF218 family)
VAPLDLVRRIAVRIVASICVGLALIVGLLLGFLHKSMWNYLIVDQAPKQADVIIVLSAGTDRVAQGVKLYQLGYAHKVLFTGASAVTMSEQAQALGLPSDAVLLERQSNTTFGNAKYSLEVMRTQGFKSAIVVTSPEHTRRADVIFTYFFHGLDLTMSSAQYDSSISDNWWKDRETANSVVTEYLKLAWFYVFEKWIPDDDIPHVFMMQDN